MNIPKIIKLPLFRWSLTAVYAVFIAVISVMPGRVVSKMAPPIPHFDKWAHGIVHAVFALLVCWAIQLKLRRLPWVLLAMAVCIAYGVLMEVAQYQVGIDRTFSWGDIVANTTGILLAIIIFAAYKRR